MCCEKRKEWHRRCSGCVLFLLSVFVRFLFVFDLSLILFRIVLWPSVGKNCQLFTVLILDAVLVVLVPLPFGVWGGMWNSVISAPDHCLLSTFHSEKWSGHGTPKAFPECRRRGTGRAREGVFHLSSGGLGDFPREHIWFRKAVDAFYCIFCAISVYNFNKFFGMLEENFLIIVIFEHLTTQTVYTEHNYFDPSPNHDGTWKSFKGHASIFPAGKSIEYERLTKIRTVQLSVSVSNHDSCMHDNTGGRLPHRNVTTFYLQTIKTENIFSLGFSDQRSVVEI